MIPPSALSDRVRRLVGTGAGPRWSSGPQLALLLAAALLAGQLAGFVWHLLPGAIRQAPPALRSSAPPSADVNEILRAHLFGNAEVPASSADAPRTQVALILAGTLAVRDPTQGLAIVGETAQAGKLYAVGAMLPGGVRLHEVYPDRVVLDRGGVLETLPLPRQLAGAGAGPPPPPLSASGNNAEPPLADSVQKLIAQGPEVVGEVLRPMPTYVGGQLKGFRVYPGRDRGKFASLGLRAGDLVTLINGVPLTDPQRGMEIMRSLGGGGAAQVTVERGAVTQQLTIDASQLAGLSQPSAQPAPPNEPTQPTSD